MEVIKYQQNLGERKDIQNAIAEQVSQKATIEYIGMMCDVDIYGDEEENDGTF